MARDRYATLRGRRRSPDNVLVSGRLTSGARGLGLRVRHTLEARTDTAWRSTAARVPWWPRPTTRRSSRWSVYGEPRAARFGSPGPAEVPAEYVNAPVETPEKEPWNVGEMYVRFGRRHPQRHRLRARFQHGRGPAPAPRRHHGVIGTGARPWSCRKGSPGHG